MIKHLTILLAFLMTLSSPVMAGAFERGLAAAEAGDFELAFQEWRFGSVIGDVNSQYNLGIMYMKGDGVLEDNIMAHMWSNIAAANGSENGGTNRDIAAEVMTPATIEKAQAMARECMNSGNTKCGY
jgi:TPR repeat protein